MFVAALATSVPLTHAVANLVFVWSDPVEILPESSSEWHSSDRLATPVLPHTKTVGVMGSLLIWFKSHV